MDCIFPTRERQSNSRPFSTRCMAGREIPLENQARVNLSPDSVAKGSRRRWKRPFILTPTYTARATPITCLWAPFFFLKLKENTTVRTYNGSQQAENRIFKNWIFLTSPKDPQADKKKLYFLEWNVYNTILEPNN